MNLNANAAEQLYEAMLATPPDSRGELFHYVSARAEEEDGPLTPKRLLALVSEGWQRMGIVPAERPQ